MSGPFEIHNAHNEGKVIGKSSVHPEIIDTRQSDEDPSFNVITVVGPEKWALARRITELLNANA